ncbi:hypothetical protein T05_6262 [Trichinella murrelli]|uniref:Uncharacterized protein n=1 Tax=Trichinella murrelli TaxID=144512 RepID=A0A0V0TDN9_9BILA|nr:hypothetical protein T05_6262 [Trichinella murrelli]
MQGRGIDELPTGNKVSAIPSPRGSFLRPWKYRSLIEHDQGSLRPASAIRCNTRSKRSVCSWVVRPKTIMSSRYGRQDDHVSPRSATSMSRWNVAGALHRSKGMPRNWYSSNGVLKAVFRRSAS